MNYFFVFVAFLLQAIMMVSGQDLSIPECYQHGECTQSLFIGDWITSDIQLCLEECQSHRDCQYFTFQESWQSCYGFANCEVFDEDSCVNCYSGSQNCPDVQCSIPGECNSNSIEEVFLETSEDCSAYCHVRTSCQWTTFDTSNGHCLLYEDCPALNSECETCLTSQRFCSNEEQESTPPPTTATTSPTAADLYSKLVVIGGYNGDAYIDTVRVVDLENEDSTCDNLADYPMVIDDSLLEYVGGVLKSCGGYNSELRWTELCFDYDPTQNVWVSSPSLLYDRYTPEGSIIDGLWLVSGDDYFPGDEITEFWNGNFFQEAAFRLPVGLSYHCQVTINDTALFFGDLLSKNYYYILSWPEGEILAEEQEKNNEGNTPYISSYVTCGLIDNPINGPEIVIQNLSQTDILNLGTLEFRDGPTFDARLWRMEAVQYRDSFIILGGDDGHYNYTNNIFRFDEINYEWIQLSQTFDDPANVLGAALVPDELVNCY